MTEPSKAKVEGMQARIDDKPASANPHPRGEQEYYDWKAGWEVANGEMERRAYERHQNEQASLRYQAVLDGIRNSPDAVADRKAKARNPRAMPHKRNGRMATYRCLDCTPKKWTRSHLPEFFAEHSDYAQWPTCYTCKKPMTCTS